MSTHQTISYLDAVDLGGKMKNIINVIFFFHPGPCYYRSYTILYVLRNLGFEIELNFGMINPFGESRMAVRAHCWLSLNGNLFLESSKVLTDYPHKAAEPRDGIIYWWGFPEN